MEEPKPPKATDILGADATSRLKDQLLIVLAKRLADFTGEVSIPIEELDNTGQDMLNVEADAKTRVFKLKLSKKN